MRAFIRVAPDQILVLESLRSLPASPEKAGPSKGLARISRVDFFLSDWQSWEAPYRLLSPRDFFAELEAPEGAHPNQPGGSDSLVPGTQWELSPRSGFEADFRQIQGMISRGEIDKAVPVVRARSSWVPSSADFLTKSLRLLRVAQESQIPFGIWSPQGGVLGLTPEILFTTQDSHLHSMALAGTQALREGLDPAKALRNPKDQHEHALVVTDLLKELSPLGVVKKHPTEVLILQKLAHLCTRLELQMTERTEARQWIKKLHPTAALGIAPRSAGFLRLKELSLQRERGFFGAPLLLEWEDSSLALVQIRSLFWTRQFSEIWSGCGIVGESQVEAEWSELLLKLNSILHLLGLDPIPEP
ncbi:MAG: chorismate-binding protein [Bdellovibrio sp.]